MASSITIDSLTVSSPFLFIPGAFRMGRVEVEAWTGDIHTYTKYVKDTFSIEFYNLTQSQMNTLTQILNQVGSEVLHTVTYTTDDLIRLYDGSTSPSGITNIDVNRVRQKVILDSPTGINHIQKAPNNYTCTLTGKEV